MRFGERLAIFIVRPIYRTFFERPFWWFLAKVKAFFFADVGVQLANIENRLGGMTTIEHRLRVLEESARQANVTNAAEWDALEQLLLALFRQPELRNVERIQYATAAEEMSISNAIDLKRVRAAINTR